MDIEKTEAQLKMDMMGYQKYTKRLKGDSSSLSTVEMRSIDAHRQDVLNKYDSAERIPLSNVLGMFMSENFFLPTDIDGGVVDADDVFAVSYAYDIDFKVWKKKKDKYILWVLFCNDKYLPVLPIVTMETASLGERILRKKKNTFLPEIQRRCQKLTYPICELKELEEQLQHQYDVRGHMSKEFMLGQIHDARKGVSIYDPMSITSELGGMTKQLLLEHRWEI